ncbi:energy-coupling factor transporter transmembrane protein EcfT [Candidatus Desantisbacteria bacterium]|nr:energy-coupling factor transporter transmembrane protein EcfT [Candidatus Desantisbacteria bacterium]
MSSYLYTDNKTIIHRLDPRTKIFILLLSFVLTFFYQHPLYVLPVGVFIMLYGLSGKALVNIKKVWFLILIISIFSIVSWSFFAKGKTLLLNRVSFEGFLYGISSALKINLMIIAGIIFLSTCRNEEVITGLIKLGLPFALSFAFGTALRLAPAFLETSNIIMEAQKSRGVNFKEGNLWKRFNNFFSLLSPIFLTAIRHANGLSMSLESRGFSSNQKRSSYIDLKFKNIDFLAITLSTIFFLLNMYLSYKGFGKINGLVL